MGEPLCGDSSKAPLEEELDFEKARIKSLICLPISLKVILKIIAQLQTKQSRVGMGLQGNWVGLPPKDGT